MGRINLKAGDEQIESWKAAADAEQLSLSAWARRVLSGAAEQVGRVAPEGERSASPDLPAEPVEQAGQDRGSETDPPAEPEVMVLGAEQARAIMDQAHGKLRPDPKSKPRPQLRDVMKGTVSGPQSVKALEAARAKQAREESFSIVCPQRASHQPGTRCPHCHGIV